MREALERPLTIASQRVTVHIASFAETSFERYLRCGVQAHGFARFHCDDRGHDHLVARACKTRGLCPSELQAMMRP